MSQPLDLVCPHCAQQLKVAGATAGKQVRCPKCHGFVRVPDSAEPPRRGPARWMVRTEDGRLYGPVSRMELEQWVNEGRVSAQCHVAPEGTEQWVWAAELLPQLAQPPRAAAAYAQAYDTPGSYRPRERQVTTRGRLAGTAAPLVGTQRGPPTVHRTYWPGRSSC